jgi:hypothetical protein
MVTMQIRNHVEDNRGYYLDFFQYSQAHQETLVASLHREIEVACRALPVSHFFHNIVIDHIAFGNEEIPIDTSLYVDRNTSGTRPDRSDFALVMDGRTSLPPDERGALCFMTARDLLRIYYGVPKKEVDRLCRRSLLFTSHNPLVAFSAGAVTSAFQLNRIKYGFKLYFRRNGVRLQDYFPGELLDVSHQLQEDTRKTWNRTSLLRLYHRSSIRHIKDLTFNTLTPYGQIQEHRFMLFRAVAVPWAVDKYEKRIIRLLCIFFLFVFSTEGPRYSFRRKLEFMGILRADIENQSMQGILPPPIMQQLRFDILLVLSGDHVGNEVVLFKERVLEMLSTLIETFKHVYRRSRNPRLTIKEYDPLVFTQFYNGE